MRILVIHSVVAADARPDELDTIISANAVARALRENGHTAALAPFDPDIDRLRALLLNEKPDAAFNMVESVSGSDALAAMAPVMFEKLGIHYTGSMGSALALAGDKVSAKTVLRAAGLPTPDWSESPFWVDIREGGAYIVKSVTEDASLGLDDGSVVEGRESIIRRATQNAERWGGRWFAEAYVEGREFNVALLGYRGRLEVLPIAEIVFEDWPEGERRIVGYGAKWDEQSEQAVKTVRVFGAEQKSPALAATLAELALDACRLLRVDGYARVDFRVEAGGRPTILEANPNPCLDPKAGFAAAANAAGLSFAEVVARILEAANHGRMEDDVPDHTGI